MGMPLGVLPAWAPASDEELALSVGSVCSAWKEVGISCPGLSEDWDKAVGGGMCPLCTQGAGPVGFLSCWQPAWCDRPISDARVHKEI